MGTIVIIAYRTPKDHWHYTVKYGMHSKGFRSLTKANEFCAQLVNAGWLTGREQVDA